MIFHTGLKVKKVMLTQLSCVLAFLQETGLLITPLETRSPSLYELTSRKIVPKKCFQAFTPFYHWKTAFFRQNCVGVVEGGVLGL